MNQETAGLGRPTAGHWKRTVLPRLATCSFSSVSTLGSANKERHRKQLNNIYILNEEDIRVIKCIMHIPLDNKFKSSVYKLIIIVIVISKLLKSQAQGTSLFKSAASRQRGCPKEVRSGFQRVRR